ncbi:MAG: helix-turn-helix domain-containing protein [Bacteroidetes bacterium]|nr:helix-turn-helix domain-containing protein [Bacteroidota bacterium]
MAKVIQIESLSVEELKGLLVETSSMAIQKYISLEKPIEDEELIIESELCKRLHRSKVTLSEWRKRGLLPFYRISRKIYYNWTEVIAALKKIERK